MEIQQIEQNVDSLLSACGFKKDGAEQPLRVLLHHLYSAVAMYKETSDSERAVIAKTNKKFRSIFEINFNLKQRKRNNKEKDRVPPTTPLQDKENKKEKDEKITHTAKRDFSVALDDRREKFRMDCFAYVGQYDNESVSNFFNYWSEENKQTKKMRFEEERYWSMARRLTRWVKNQYTASDTAATIRLRKTKKNEAQETEVKEKQRVIAAEREQAQQQLEQAQEQSKAGAVSYEEWQRLRGKKQ